MSYRNVVWGEGSRFAGVAAGVILMLGLAVATPAQAQVTLHHSRSIFLQATQTEPLNITGLIPSTFPNNWIGGNVGYAVGGSINYSNYRFTGTTILNGSLTETYLIEPVGNVGPTIAINNKTSIVGGRQSLTIFPPANRTAFGVDVGQSDRTGSAIVIAAVVTLNDGRSFTYPVARPGTGSAFFGIATTVPIRSVMFVTPQSSLGPFIVAADIASGVTNLSPPTTQHTLTGDLGNNDWYRGPVQVTLTASDVDGSQDIFITQYRVDGGPAQDYNGPFTISSEGTHTVTYQSVDRAGNIEPLKTVTIKIDSKAPTGFGFKSVTPSTTIGGNDPTTSVVAFEGNVDDYVPGSGLEFTGQYTSIDSEGRASTQGTFLIDPATGKFTLNVTFENTLLNGVSRSYEISLRVRDRAGNVTNFQASQTLGKFTISIKPNRFNIRTRVVGSGVRG